MKKMLIGTFLWMFALAGVAVLPNQVNAQPLENSSATTDWEKPGGTDMITGKAQTESKLLDTVKSTINWILGLLATIALVICLYAGFLMVTSAGDEKKYQKGFTILKYAAIGLVIIGLSWLIVSVIFWFIKLQWWSDNTIATN